MRSFFKKPAWANEKKESSPLEFYRRSHQTYEDIVQSNQRLAKVSADSTSKESSYNDPPQSKRRRLSESNNSTAPEDTTEDAPEDAPLQPLPLENDSRSKSEASIPVSDHTSPPSQSPYHEEPDHEESYSTSDIDSSDNDGNIAVSEPKPRTNHGSQESQPERNPTVITSSQPSSATTSAVPWSAAGRDGHGPIEQKQNDPVVRILITSKIENTQPLYVQRLLSQRLKDVRLVWCERQKFDRKLTASIILTWKGKRVFDSTTCKSLLASSATNMDRILWSSRVEETEAADSPYDMHLEATTVDLLAADCEPWNKSSQSLSRDSPEPNVSPVDNLIAIVLKNPAQGEVKIKVRPGTKISSIVNIFRQKRGISKSAVVELSFDGDILGLDTQIKDHEIADMDLIDVLVRS
jgi:hypothetical protein